MKIPKTPSSTPAPSARNRARTEQKQKTSTAPPSSTQSDEPDDVVDNSNVSLRRSSAPTVDAASGAQKAELRKYFLDVQREQWSYYAEHMGPSTNHLPPDNVRVEAGKPIVVDYRTSPTNVGLAMLCTVTAQKLGYIDEGEALKRLRDTAETLKKLPKYKGTVVDDAGKSHEVEHLYNWYSINGEPKEIGGGFISTVDNGNFVAFAIAILTALGDRDPALSKDLQSIVDKMRFDPFFDKKAGLLHHGGHVAADGKLNMTGGHYDMLITEARCAYAAAIMLGQIPKSSWSNMKTKLGKELDGLQNNPALEFQSYTGTMFEYLTPRLLMKHAGTPLGKADEQAVHIQMSEKAGDIWGKSEANSTTSQGYAAYGARGLSQSKEFLPAGLDVIAPYASQMATSLAPEQVKKNLEKMTEHGLRGKHGFYESVTVRKRGEGGKDLAYEVTPQFFAHHIGMGLVGTANYLLGDVITDWFHGSPLNKNGVVEELLKTPVSAYKKPATKRVQEAAISNAYAYERQVTYDKTNIIGSGQFVANVKKVGGSTWAAQHYALSNNEVFYLRDNAAGTMLPLKLDAPDRVVTTEHGRRFEYDVPVSGGKMAVAIDISVTADRVKVSKIEVDNQTGRDQDIAVTGYLDWVMDDINAYLSHPVYRNLYVETELDAKNGAVIARRRTMQGPDQDRQPFGFFAVDGKLDWADSSRTNIVGRLGSLAAPRAVVDGKAPGEFGATLDPAAALTKSIQVKSGAKGEVSFIFGHADDKHAIPEILARVRKDSKPDAGVPHYPPDDAHAQMQELSSRSERALRMTAGRIMPKSTAPDGTKAYRFDDGGRKLVITDPFATKKPWSMVVSNGSFGFVATAAGWAYSFGGNSQQNRITPYAPDNTTELPLRGVVVKDKKTGASFSIAPNPQPGNGKYEVEMSPGYVKYKFTSDDGLRISMTQFVAAKDPCEMWQIDVENDGAEGRELELSSFLKWALGANYPRTASLTKTTYDDKSGAVFAESTDSILPGSVAFHALVGGNVRQNDVFGTKSDPFDGLALDLSVAAKGGKKSVSFVLGQAASKAEAVKLVDKFKTVEAISAERDVSVGAITKRLDGMQVKTPDASFDTMINTWLPYQAYDAHFKARSGYYQSGGAFGFRDQLQTTTNLLSTGDKNLAKVAREHIVESAKHQFEKGDVQHWWHPHNNLGQRSTISDNLLWLPVSVAQYLEVTGDKTILDEQAPFVLGRDLKDGELDYVEPMKFSDNTASVYEHAKRAIDLVLTRTGKHGLPLIGKGDWNDGLDRVGHLGKGESVWLGFFLYDALEKFANVADKRGDDATAKRYREKAVELKKNIEQHGWHDGHYARAYADSGEKIDFNDSIVQAWAVLSGGADEKRAVEAVGSAVHHLYDEDSNMILLFDKPLDKETWGGSLAAYPNGLRENNAQYTHGSSWLPRAVAQLGDGDWAMKLLRATLPTVHASDPRYGAEPHVVAADIYGGKRAGEGGWSWYSGGPGWIYRTGVELILGLQAKNGDELAMNPCIPRKWPGFSATHKHGSSTYLVDVKNPDGVSRGIKSMKVDGKSVDPSQAVKLIDDGKEHRIDVVMGAVPGAPAFSLDAAIAAAKARG
jgi:cellobiose phosphorylase